MNSIILFDEHGLVTFSFKVTVDGQRPTTVGLDVFIVLVDFM